MGLVASLIQGTKNRFTTNPGLSLQTMMTLPIVLQYCSTASIVSWEVVSAGIISTRRFLAGW